MKILKSSTWLRQIFLLSILAILSSSCAKVMYKPNMVNVPTFKEKGEIKGTISSSNFQGAYAVTENIGVMLNGYYKPGGWTGSYDDGFDFVDYEYVNDRSLVELGGGYFGALSDDAIWEVYGGGGLGNITYNYIRNINQTLDYQNLYSVGFMKFFVQPSIGISNDYVDFIVSTRLVGIKFSTPKTSGYTEQDLINENIFGLDQSMYLFMEPAMTFRFGYKWAKIHMQYAYSAKLTDDNLNAKETMFNMGITVNIANRFNK